MRGSATTAETLDAWPELPWREWEPTITTIHMWLQIVGKVRMALAPPLNHWWHIPLYVSSRGLTTSPIPYGRRQFQGHRSRPECHRESSRIDRRPGRGARCRDDNETGG